MCAALQLLLQQQHQVMTMTMKIYLKPREEENNHLAGFIGAHASCMQNPPEYIIADDYLYMTLEQTSPSRNDRGAQFAFKKSKSHAVRNSPELSHFATFFLE
jgi:hypothetical protein